MGSAAAAMLLRSVAVLALLATAATTAAAQNSGTATFYGGRDGSGTMGTLLYTLYVRTPHHVADGDRARSIAHAFA